MNFTNELQELGPLSLVSSKIFFLFLSLSSLPLSQTINALFYSAFSPYCLSETVLNSSGIDSILF